jgi:hypothetical protein
MSYFTPLYITGQWTREVPCVSEEFVLHFLARIREQTDQVISPHSVKHLSHRGFYKVQTYRVYNMGVLKMVLEEQEFVLRLCH